MKILAIDTTAKTAAIAIAEGKQLIASATLNAPGTHSVTILPAVDMLLKGSSLTVSDIDVFACSAGPGSFTGVRIGVSLIKGLAFGRSIPCVGVSTLEALAEKCFYNPSYFSRAFKAYAGVTFSEYLTECRIERAKELLSATELSIETVIGESGYSNRTKFFADFSA